MRRSNLKKWNEVFKRLVQKSDSGRRKQYRKARYRKQAGRSRVFNDMLYAEMTTDEPWEWKFHEIWVI